MFADVTMGLDLSTEDKPIYQSIIFEYDKHGRFDREFVHEVIYELADFSYANVERVRRQPYVDAMRFLEYLREHPTVLKLKWGYANSKGKKS